MCGFLECLFNLSVKSRTAPRRPCCRSVLVDACIKAESALDILINHSTHVFFQSSVSTKQRYRFTPLSARGRPVRIGGAVVGSLRERRPRPSHAGCGGRVGALGRALGVARGGRGSARLVLRSAGGLGRKGVGVGCVEVGAAALRGGGGDDQRRLDREGGEGDRRERQRLACKRGCKSTVSTIAANVSHIGAAANESRPHR